MKKKYLVTIGVAFLLISTAASAFAASGKAIIPLYRYSLDSAGAKYFIAYTLSNVTSSNIHVTIKLYKNPTGSETGPVLLRDTLGDANNPGNGIFYAADVINYSESTSGVSASFDIAPFTMAQFAVMPPSIMTGGMGSGVVEWSQDSDALVGLVAEGILELFYNNVASISTMQINGGKAF